MGMRKAKALGHAAQPAVGVGYMDGELARIHQQAAFSFGSAVKYVTILSILLWWLPTFGQMIAGYVGGRRAGSPWRGVAASLVPVFAIFIGLHLVNTGFFGDPAWLQAWPAAAVVEGERLPVVGPYVSFIIGYAGAFLDSIRLWVFEGLNGYLVTIVFAYIGGIFADQAARESSARGGSHVGVSITQPLLPSFHRQKAPARLARMHRVAAGAEVDHEEAPEPGAAPEDDDEEDEDKKPSPASTAPVKAGATEKYVSKALRRYDRPRAAR